MSKYFSISGYWLSDNEEFEGYLVKEDNDIIEEEDDQIFFYGLSENDIKEAIRNKDHVNGEFIITNYEI